jgi:hypothetical protein
MMRRLRVRLRRAWQAFRDPDVIGLLELKAGLFDGDEKRDRVAVEYAKRNRDEREYVRAIERVNAPGPTDTQ